jgi:peptide deformylase
MAILPIQLLGQSVLREVAKTIDDVDDELRALIADMYETMDTALGVGLAANQVGIARRVAVIEAEDHRFTMINPRILESSGNDSAEEGCLSMPEAHGDVSRPAQIVLEATNEDGEKFRLELAGLAARAVQHEIDHLDGILFIDHLSPLKRQLLVKRWKKENKDSGPTWLPTPEESEATS